MKDADGKALAARVPWAAVAYAPLAVNAAVPNAPVTVFRFETVAVRPVRLVAVAALPVVSWFRVGKSTATAILGTPVPVVFFKIPVARPASEVPFIFTTVRAVAPVASPVWVAFVTSPLYRALTASSPVLVLDRVATAVFASIPSAITPAPIEVTLPTLVTTPVRLAFVVTVAALPVISPAMALVNVFIPPMVWFPVV